jgi:hypothetical protein
LGNWAAIEGDREIQESSEFEDAAVRLDKELEGEKDKDAKGRNNVTKEDSNVH